MSLLLFLSFTTEVIVIVINNNNDIFNDYNDSCNNNYDIVVEGGVSH